MSDWKRPVVFIASLALAAILKWMDLNLEIAGTAHYSLLPLCLVSVALITLTANKRWGTIGAVVIAIGWVLLGEPRSASPHAELIRRFYALSFATLFIVLAIFVAGLVQSMRLAWASSWKDDVTDLLNATHFQTMARTEIARANRYKRPFTIAFIAIPGFGPVQKKGGTDVGRALLKRLGEVLQKNLRAVDIIGRVGDEEFSVFFPETGQEGARVALPRLLHALVQVFPAYDAASPFAVCAISCLEASESLDQIQSLARAEIASAVKHGNGEIVFKWLGNVQTAIMTAP